jgi:hypothetical protein
MKRSVESLFRNVGAAQPPGLNNFLQLCYSTSIFVRLGKGKEPLPFVPATS